MNESITIRRWQTVRLGTEAKRRVSKAKAEGLCVACLKPAEGRMIRGCHFSCYRATLRAIERGLTSEQERVSEGKILPVRISGRKPKNPVTIDVMGGGDE
jgi:hypothetical protein